MSIVQKLGANGSFRLDLKKDAPESLHDAIGFFDHIFVTKGRLDPRQHSAADIQAAAYWAGVIIRKPREIARSYEGVNLIWWLGDGKNVGKMYRDANKLSFVADAFGTGITATLAAPTPITEGTIGVTEVEGKKLGGVGGEDEVSEGGSSAHEPDGAGHRHLNEGERRSRGCGELGVVAVTRCRDDVLVSGDGLDFARRGVLQNKDDVAFHCAFLCGHGSPPGEIQTLAVTPQVLYEV